MKAVYKLMILGMCMLALPSFAQTKFGDVILPNKLSPGGVEFKLNGGGIREKMWIDLYVGGLYLTEKTSDANKVMNADQPMLIHLHIVSGMITSEKMINACNEGFENSTGGNTDPIKNEIAQFIDAFKEPIQENDTYDLIYTPGEGTKILKNGKTVKTIKGLAFKKALFGIWFCDKPADNDLKEGMLGL